jgi:hypothetical protein
MFRATIPPKEKEPLLARFGHVATVPAFPLLGDERT